jgi:hypothetical protein
MPQTQIDLTDTAVIGRIPGYNSNIDGDGKFAQELLKGVTFIDLLPSSYKAAVEFQNNEGIVEAFKNGASKLFKAKSLFQTDSNASTKLFAGILKQMESSLDIPGFSNVKKLRIVAANDSTFTETLSNDFSEKNALVQLGQSIVEKNGFIASTARAAQFITKGVKGYSYSQLQSLVSSAYQSTGANANNAWMNLLMGAAFGMNLAAPSSWGGSQYTSTLNVFIKLISPVGSPECIRHNIIKPLLYLVAAASPITAHGLMYGFPLLWSIDAKGIAQFRLGAIAALTIIRGSYETTFNANLQPTVVDVRLTIVPLLNDFAVQTDSGADSIYKQKIGDGVPLGVQHPGDIYHGTMQDDSKERIYSIKL